MTYRLFFAFFAASSYLLRGYSLELKEDQWVEKQVKELRIGSFESYPLTEISLSVTEMNYYSALQKKIAEIIPRESQRVPFLLHVSGEETFLNRCHFGVLGGIGPLSDARIINQVMEKLSKKGLSQFCTVNLLSAPPPRDFWEVMSKGFSYAWRLYGFLQEERELVYLASNTAHIHFDWISKMSRGCLVNLTDYVADKVQSVLENPYVLIVGTKAGQKANLYGKLFAERSIPYAYLEQHEQDRVDLEIEKAKKGFPDGGELYKLLEKSIHKTGVNVVLLSCTELPMALELFVKQLEAFNVVVIDSEKLFVEKICADVEKKFFKD